MSRKDVCRDHGVALWSLVRNLLVKGEPACLIAGSAAPSGRSFHAWSSAPLPTVSVKCVTCHHGVAQPRTLQDVLANTYQSGGIDSAVARYQALRDRYYGQFAYDFGEVPLVDVSNQLRQQGHAEDASR